VTQHDAGEGGDIDILGLARRSEDFRREVITGKNMQIVVMTIRPGDEIGEEVHHDIDQVLLFVDGEGESIIEGRRAPVSAGHLTFVPGGTLHNFVNTGDTPLRIVTAYAPPEHEAGTVHPTKADADAAEEHHH
jgi:mannose-6-phosphate isomerase-like protein (cupin superfamily)